MVWKATLSKRKKSLAQEADVNLRKEEFSSRKRSLAQDRDDQLRKE